MSDITIEVDAGSTQETSSAYATGTLRHIITEEERATFGILDGDLKIKVGAVMGKQPDDVWVRSPTLWGDMYKMYSWEEVRTVLTPIETKILSVDTVPTVIYKMDLRNESSKKGTFTGKLSKQVSTTVETSWSQSYTLSFNQQISYGVKFMGVGIDGSTSFGFQGQWGKNTTESRNTTIGTEAGVSVDLEPGEGVVAELSANVGKMKVRVTYEAHLTGLTAINYDKGYEGHHYYGVPMSMVLGDSNRVKISEDIDIVYYDEARVTIKDRAGKMLRCERAPCFF